MDEKCIQDLLKESHSAALRSYSPYSNEKQGAALKTLNGTIFTGCTVENAAYPNSVSAVRNAIVNLLSSELGGKSFDTHECPIEACGFMEANMNDMPTLCGMSRQCLVEFGDFPVYLGYFEQNSTEIKYVKTSSSQLLPFYPILPKQWNFNGTYSATEWWKDVQYKTFVSSDGEELPAFLPELLKSAVNTAKNAYIPISNFPVGAALLTDKGIFGGANVENSSLQATLCAERTAISKAINGGTKNFKAMAVFCIKITDHYAKPCGGCRQSLVEFGNFDIYCFNYKGNGLWNYETTTSLNLLPYAFTPADLS